MEVISNSAGGSAPQVIHGWVTNRVTGVAIRAYKKFDSAGNATYHDVSDNAITLSGDQIFDLEIHKMAMGDSAVGGIVDTAASSLTSVGADTRYARIEVRNNPIAFTISGTTPDVATGEYVQANVGDIIVLDDATSIGNFSAKALNAGTSSDVYASFWNTK